MIRFFSQSKVNSVLSPNGAAVATGSVSMDGFSNYALIKSIEIQTSCPSWDLILYGSSDYSSDEQVVVGPALGNGNLTISRDIIYRDLDSTEKLHYIFTSNAGSYTHNIIVRALQLQGAA